MINQSLCKGMSRVLTPCQNVLALGLICQIASKEERLGCTTFPIQTDMLFLEMLKRSTRFPNLPPPSHCHSLCSSVDMMDGNLPPLGLRCR